jgi:serine O-acetyltransferase
MLRWLLARTASARGAALEDVAAVLERDPAARSAAEVVLCYPGLHALWLHRLAHRLHGRGWYLAARLVSHLGRGLTGVEIHPGARVGRRVVIDHGMGVVIGETAEVGDDVLLYQGVTLGGTSMERSKRHPTVGSRVVIGAGAKVLGPITVGDDARVGAGSVVTRPVEAGATVVGVPAHAVRKQRSALLPMPNLEHADMSDPVVEAVRALLQRIDEVETELRALRGLQHQHASDDRRSADEALAALMRDGGGI